MKQELTAAQKKLDTDIWIIALITLAGFMFYMINGNKLAAFIDDEHTHILLRTIVVAFLQFSIAGLGSMIVCILRKETLAEMGIRKKGALKAILSSVICFLPYLVYLFASGQFSGYMPLSILISDNILSSTILNKIIGMTIVVIAWGFFEGFNYYIISKKINQRYPGKIDSGAVTCALVCILFHPFRTSFWGIIEILATFIFIYGMVHSANKNKNAWGCIFSFLFLWNAF